MKHIIDSLVEGNISYFVKHHNEFSDYAIVYALAKLNTQSDALEVVCEKAQSLINRANAKVPMNFELEAHAIYMLVWEAHYKC